MQVVLREVVALGGSVAAGAPIELEVIKGADDLALELLHAGEAVVIEADLEGGLVAGHSAEGPHRLLLRGGVGGKGRCGLLIHRTGLDLPIQLRNIVRQCRQYAALEIHRRLCMLLLLLLLLFNFLKVPSDKALHRRCEAVAELGDDALGGLCVSLLQEGRGPQPLDTSSKHLLAVRCGEDKDASLAARGAGIPRALVDELAVVLVNRALLLAAGEGSLHCHIDLALGSGPIPVAHHLDLLPKGSAPNRHPFAGGTHRWLRAEAKGREEHPLLHVVRQLIEDGLGLLVSLNVYLQHRSWWLEGEAVCAALPRGPR